MIRLTKRPSKMRVIKPQSLKAKPVKIPRRKVRTPRI